jgi:hypothetical protein
MPELDGANQKKNDRVSLVERAEEARGVER